MNEHRKLELEQFFDGELALDEQARVASELAHDDQARAYLTQLAELRRLALRDDYGAALPVAGLRPLPWARRPVGRRWMIAAAVAAGIAGLIWLGTRPERAGPADKVPIARSPGTKPRPPELTASRPGASRPQLHLDAQSFAWANGEAAAPAQAARVVLGGATRVRGRAAAEDEILALRMANAAPKEAQSLARVAAQRESLRRHATIRSRVAQRPQLTGRST